MAEKAQRLDGSRLAKTVLAKCAVDVQAIRSQTSVVPSLATVLVGDDPASATYVAMKGRRCEQIAMRSVHVQLPGTCSTQELVAKIEQLSNDPSIHGILLQHPVPNAIDERAAFEAIQPAKDVDGVTMHSFAATAFDLLGEDGFGYGACTPAGIMRLLDEYGVPLGGKSTVVLGRSAIVGKPMAMMLLARHATVTICHSRTKDLPHVVQAGDLVVAAVGKPQFVQGPWIKPGAVVVDAGWHPNSGKVGDVDFEPAAARASMITPVPGGVGPMTIAMLIEQTVIAASKQLGVDLKKEPAASNT